tara:strand:+ start:12257 stop:12712 length:456 start_codon:yes stop_codon:yes gene_type:complete
MARIDYYDIEVKIRDILDAEASLTTASITIEEDQPLDTNPWVAIHLENRASPEGQPIAAGTRTRYRIRFSIWCWCWSLESGRAAAEARDDLIGNVEIALMKNRTLTDTVLHSWLEGGDFITTKHEVEEGITGTAYMSGGQVVLMAEANATT